jgi:hypothetical protein
VDCLIGWTALGCGEFVNAKATVDDYAIASDQTIVRGMVYFALGKKDDERRNIMFRFFNGCSTVLPKSNQE